MGRTAKPLPPNAPRPPRAPRPPSPKELKRREKKAERRANAALTAERAAPRFPRTPQELAAELRRVDAELAWRSPAGLAAVATGGRWKRYPHLEVLHRRLLRVAEGGCRRLIVMFPPQHGKALADDTPILTLDGWKRHGELQPGDFVFSPQGRPIRIVAVTPPFYDETYRLTFDEGTQIVAGARHEWISDEADEKHVRTSRVVETRALTVGAKSERNRRASRIRLTDPVWFPKRNLLVDPYLLGLWLGDGSSSSGSMTSGEQDIEHFSKYGIAKRVKPGIWRVRFPGLQIKLRAMGLLRNKHIPDEYLVSSREQRWDLLQGLMDTDGCAERPRTHGRCTFCTKYASLAASVQELCCSLGLKARVRSKMVPWPDGRLLGPYFTISFTPRPGDEVFRLARKQCKAQDGRGSRRLKSYCRYLVRMEKIDPVPLRCIQVEGGTYLAGRTLIPTHNSSLASLYFPAWLLGRYPDKRIILASYEAEFAAGWGRRARDVLTERGPAAFGVGVKGDTHAADRWDVVGRGTPTGMEGGMTTAGVGGPITGRRGDVVIVDDPVKNQEEAASETIREKHYEWWLTVAMTRLSERGAAILVMTRWHERDLAGRLLADSAAGRGEPWEVLRMPALAEDDEVWEEPATGLDMGRPGLPAFRWPRAKGAALCPELFSAETLTKRRDAMDLGPHLFAGLYQQRPYAREGGMFDVQALRARTVRVAPVNPKRIGRGWDLAATEKKGSKKTAGVRLSYVSRERRFYIEHVVEGKWLPDRRNEIMLATVKRDGLETKQLFEHEGGSAGEDQALGIIRLLAGFRAEGVRVTGDKVTRADAAAAQVNGGNVYLVDDATWDVETFLSELAAFPKGEYLDPVDAFSLIFNWLATGLGGGTIGAVAPAQGWRDDFEKAAPVQPRNETVIANPEGKGGAFAEPGAGDADWRADFERMAR